MMVAYFNFQQALWRIVLIPLKVVFEPRGTDPSTYYIPITPVPIGFPAIDFISATSDYPCLASLVILKSLRSETAQIEDP